MKGSLFFLFLALSMSCVGQDTNPLTLTDDAQYFNFWEGTWYVVKDDNTLDTTNFFKIKRSVHPAAFEEQWGKTSIAVRAWDKTNNKWGFVWVSANGLFQVWDSRKVGDHWYIYKHFDVNGDKYLSRQGFLPQQDGTVIRISEKSYDDKNWQLRFKQTLRKVK